MILQGDGRAAWFFAERVVAQAGGLAFAAVLARRAGAEEAAAFLAAYALASIFQPLFANACQPLAMRLWRDHGARAFLALWVGLICLGAATGAALFVVGGGAAVFALAAAAPMAAAAAPLIAEDRWRAALSILIPVAAVGGALRVAALLAFDSLAPAGALFAFEPLVGGLLLARRGRLLARRREGAVGPGFAALRRAAPPLMLAMAATTVFWRGPVLIAEAVLAPADALRVAFALQAVGGFLLIPNAVVQSLFGRMAAGGGERLRAAAMARGAGLAGGALALAVSLIFGEPLLALVYGPAGVGAGPTLALLSPLVALGAFWRVEEFAAGFDGRGGGLLAARLSAVAGLAAGGWAAAVWPHPETVAAAATLSLAASLALSRLTPRFAAAATPGPRLRREEAPARPEPQGSRD